MPQSIDADDELGLSDYLRIARRRWSWVLLPLVAVLALATAFTLRQPPRFCATAQVLLAPSEAQVAIQGDASVPVANRDLANEINIAYSDDIRRQVIGQLGLEPDIEIVGEPDSDILWFQACASTAEGSAQEANTWAGIYVSTKQQQAAADLDAAVTGFEVRLGELRDQRRLLRQDVDRLRRQLVTADGDEAKAAIQVQVDQLELELAIETQLIDAQIATIAQNITLLELDGELARAGTARVIQLAAPPLEHSNAPLSRNLVLGGLIGLVIGGALALIRDHLDQSIKSVDDVVGVPVLGAVPKPGRGIRQRETALATMNYPGSPVAEAYQKVRTAVEFAVMGRELTSLLITSPNPSEGKTTTSSNLAWAMSAVDHRVVLADVDFRRPRIHQVFGCRGEPGLSDRLLKGTALNRLALRVDDDHRNLVIIPTGTRPPTPADFVASPAFAGLIRSLESEADLVVLDSPPVLPVSDALSMARQVDAVIVVAKAGSTKLGELTEAVEALRAVGADVLGVCLVGVKLDASRYGYGPAEPPRRNRQGQRRRAATPSDRTEPVSSEPRSRRRDTSNGQRPEPASSVGPEVEPDTGPPSDDDRTRGRSRSDGERRPTSANGHQEVDLRDEPVVDESVADELLDGETMIDQPEPPARAGDGHSEPDGTDPVGQTVP